MAWRRCSIFSHAIKAERKLSRGSRFGPKLAIDGGRIFQSSSRDVTRIIRRKKLTEEQTDDYYKRGIITQWIESPKNLRGRKIVESQAKTGWKRATSVRVGVLGKKIGMSSEVDVWGEPFPVTLIQLRDNQVLQVKTNKDHQLDKEYYTMQVGAGLRNWYQFNKSMMGHFAKADVPPKERIAEFKVTKEALLEVGTTIPVTHFVPGQYVDVKAVSKSKGFQGVMKHYGFAGGPASHGSSKFHRRPGSIAAGKTDGGRVWKGKKMPGRMGGKTTLVYCLQVLKINTKDGILFVKGSVPGPKGCWIKVTDSAKRKPRLPPPFPTCSLELAKRKKKYLRKSYPDPFAKERTVDWETKWRQARAALKAQGDDRLDEDDDDEGEGEGDEKAK